METAAQHSIGKENLKPLNFKSALCMTAKMAASRSDHKASWHVTSHIIQG